MLGWLITMQHKINRAKERKRMVKMEKKIPEGIDPHNIRSKEQLDATLSWWEAGNLSGCRSWCNDRENQESLLVFETTYWEVRKEADKFKKPGAERWFLILKRHAALDDITPEEWMDYGPAKQRIHKEFDIRGCFINRVGPKENTASSLLDDHYYEIAVKTTPGVPYKETLVKDLTGENLQRLDNRTAEITKE